MIYRIISELADKNSLIFFIDGHVVFRFFHFYFKTGGDLLANPVGDVLGGWVERQDIVEVLMVEFRLDRLFDMAEIDNHAILVQRERAAVNGDYPIVTMRMFAFTGIGQSQAV